MKMIPLSGKYGTGKYALVDDEDFEKVNQYKWYMVNDRHNYAARNLRIRNRLLYIPMHRFVLNLDTKKETKLDVDHVNRNCLDNRKENLRVCLPKENSRNQTLNRKNNTSGYKGAYWHIRRKTWYSSIKINKKRVHLGCYTTKEEAALAYNKAARIYYGDFAHLNMIQ